MVKLVTENIVLVHNTKPSRKYRKLPKKRKLRESIETQYVQIHYSETYRNEISNFQSKFHAVYSYPC